MFQIRDNKPKQLARHTMAAAFACAFIPAGPARIYIVRKVMAPRKELAP